MNKTFSILTNIVSVAVLVSSIFLFGTTISQSEEYDPWIDYNDDGYINIKEAVILGTHFGTSGTPINKTEMLLNLQARVEALETGGYIGAPAYDSGWISIASGETLYLQHDLFTDEVFVYLTAIDDDFGTVHQQSYGGASIRYPPDHIGAWWFSLNYTHILVSRAVDDEAPYDLEWDHIRVQIWKIPEP